MTTTAKNEHFRWRFLVEYCYRAAVNKTFGPTRFGEYSSAARFTITVRCDYERQTSFISLLKVNGNHTGFCQIRLHNTKNAKKKKLVKYDSLR